MISSEGRLANSHTGKILSVRIGTSGYVCHSNRVNGKDISFTIHRLVAEAFLEAPSQELLDWANKSFRGVVQVNHKDGNKTNNIPENLEWCNNKQNKIHSRDMMIDLHQTSLTREQILFIKKNYIPRDNIYGGIALAKKFDVSKFCISRITRSLSYKEITETTK